MSGTAAPSAVFAPGRVNLIGDHTDYTGGLALPLAIDLGVQVRVQPGRGDQVLIRSEALGTAALPLGGLIDDPAVISAFEPPWVRTVAAVLAWFELDDPLDVEITSTLPVGIGLSSSAALCVALIELLTHAGHDADTLATLAQGAEHLAGAPVGRMDPLISAAAEAGSALLLDFTRGTHRPVPLPADAEVVVVDSGQARTVAASAYRDRVRDCLAIEAVLGPLATTHLEELTALEDPLLRQRARHVLTENRRVLDTVVALEAEELDHAGTLLTESHWSLAHEYEVSTPSLDALVDELTQRSGVFGARLTGAGFGGCVVALCEPGALTPEVLHRRLWVVQASDGVVARRVR